MAPYLWLYAKMMLEYGVLPADLDRQDAFRIIDIIAYSSKDRDESEISKDTIDPDYWGFYGL